MPSDQIYRRSISIFQSDPVTALTCISAASHLATRSKANARSFISSERMGYSLDALKRMFSFIRRNCPEADKLSPGRSSLTIPRCARIHATHVRFAGRVYRRQSVSVNSFIEMGNSTENVPIN
jgi:hypothetical protein